MSTNLTSRTLHLINALKGHSLSGKSLRELAAATKIPEPTAVRILETMIEEGFVMKLDTGRYSLSIRVLQIAQAHANEMSRATDRINELNQRVQAGAQG